MEKEERLIEIMKMNGLNIKNYWIVNFLFNFTIYFLLFVLFLLFGYFILELSFFTQTNIWLLLTVFLGWGLS